MSKLTLPTFFLVAALLSTSACSLVRDDAKEESPHTTWRIEYRHHLAADGSTEEFELDRVVVEGSFSGVDPAEFEEDDLGLYRAELVEAASGEVFCSAGFCSMFGEWKTTDDSKAHPERVFEESIRLPSPPSPCRLRISKRDAQNRFSPIFEAPTPPIVETKAECDPSDVLAIGPLLDSKTQVDLLFLGDGYAVADKGKFFADATRLSSGLLAREPYRAHRERFNVRARFTASAVSGVANPDAGVERDSALGCRYSTFGLPRYVLTTEDRKWRAAAGCVPYDAVIILLNASAYGGGGIFNLYCIAAADNAVSPYLVAHEFGHSFSGLGDEYYTSPVAYRDFASKTVEPWEPNVTALLDPRELKWRDRVEAGTPLPSPWRKGEYDTLQKQQDALRAILVSEGKPPALLGAMVLENKSAALRRIFSGPERMGAYEGALYESHGLFRPAVDCIMFRRDCERYCGVCAGAIERRISSFAP